MKGSKNVKNIRKKKMNKNRLRCVYIQNGQRRGDNGGGWKGDNVGTGGRTRCCDRRRRR